MRIRTFLSMWPMWLAVSAAVLASGCGSSSDPPPPGATFVAKPIGAEGGTIEVGGAVVTFPKGALTESKNISISVVDNGVPDGFIALSKVFKCEPAGTDFLEPVEMRMPFTDDGKGGSLFWQSGADPAFKDLGGRIEGTTMIATVKHFSGGFVGRRQ